MKYRFLFFIRVDNDDAMKNGAGIESEFENANVGLAINRNELTANVGVITNINELKD